LISPDGRYYIAFIWRKRNALLDLWDTGAGVKASYPTTFKTEEKLPVYKMPHLEGWAVAVIRVVPASATTSFRSSTKELELIKPYLSLDNPFL